MESPDTKRMYIEIKNAANMGINSIDDMLRRCADEYFRIELMHVQNEYRSIAMAAGGEETEPEGSRMLTKMEAALIGEYVGADSEKSTYARADARAAQLADRLLTAQRRHRAIYKKYLS